MDRLFKSFSQVDSSTTRKYGGTGLGLVISKRLSEMMGGDIQMESTEGNGTTFRFTIRTHSATIEPPEFMTSDQPSLAGRQILIVDDNAMNREIVGRQAASWGIKPTLVPSGVEALEMIGSENIFDMAILDMYMPEMTGAELIRQLRAEGLEMPVVLCTGLAQEVDEEVARSVGAQRLLAKPFCIEELGWIVRRLLDESA